MPQASARRSTSELPSPPPNNALQRTAHGGRVISAIHVLRRHEPSLSLEALGRYAMTPQQAEAVTRILRERCGQWTLVQLRDGQQIRVFDIAWGRDMGADFDHITTNISPGPAEEHTIDFFLTSEVVGVSDPFTGQSLLPTSAA